MLYNHVYATCDRGVILEIVDRQEFLGSILDSLNITAEKLNCFRMYRVLDLPAYTTAGVFLEKMMSDEAPTHFVGAVRRVPILRASLVPEKPLKVDVLKATAADKKDKNVSEVREVLQKAVAVSDPKSLIDVVSLLFHDRLNGLCVLKGKADGTFAFGLYMTGILKQEASGYLAEKGAKYFADYPELQRWLIHSAELDRFYEAVKVINEG